MARPASGTEDRGERRVLKEPETIKFTAAEMSTADRVMDRWLTRRMRDGTVLFHRDDEDLWVDGW